MLVELDFPYLAQYRVKRGRADRQEFLLGRETFHVPDLPRASTTPVFAIGKMKPAGTVCRPRPEITVLAAPDGLYWPVTDEAGQPISVRHWAKEIQPRSASSAANSSAPADLFADVLGMRLVRKKTEAEFERGYRHMLQRQYNGDRLRTAEEAGVHDLTFSTHRFSQNYVARAAANLASVDGMLYRRRGEPVIVLHRSCLSEDLKLEIMSESDIDSDLELYRGEPFLFYQLFRADQLDDAITVGRHLDWRFTTVQAISLAAGSLPNIRIMGDDPPQFDSVTPMMRDLEQRLRNCLHGIDEASVVRLGIEEWLEHDRPSWRPSRPKDELTPRSALELADFYRAIHRGLSGIERTNQNEFGLRRAERLLDLALWRFDAELSAGRIVEPRLHPKPPR